MSVATESPSIATKPLSSTPLRAVLGVEFALRPRHLVLCLSCCVLFVYLNYIPIFHSDLWGHVKIGQWILSHHALPTTDPFLPLAEGMRVVDTAWLSQIVLASVEHWGGASALSNFFAAITLATFLIYARVFFLQTRRVELLPLGMGLLLLLGWTRHAVLRPEILAALCLATLWWLLARCAPWPLRKQQTSGPSVFAAFPRIVWIGVPLLMALWANLHGSFAIGIAVLGCHALGRGIDTAWREKNLLAALSDRTFQAWVLLTELALVATLINPYGMQLWWETLRFSHNENLRDVLEWFPLKLMDLEGIELAGFCVLLVAVLRHSRQRVEPVQVLLFILFAAAAAPTVRMMTWFAPIATVAIMPHLGDLWRRWQSGARQADKQFRADFAAAPAPRHFVYSLLCLLTVWIAFSIAPVSQSLLGGKARAPQQLYSRQTPLAVTEYLRAHAPKGLVYAPQWWGDWLVWDGPASMRVFMTTNIHLAPRQVWRDYMRISGASAGWERVLDKYSVGTVVVHKDLQPGLAAAVRRSGEWHIAYEDRLALVLERKPK